MSDAEKTIRREVLREKMSREAGGCRRGRRDTRLPDRHLQRQHKERVQSRW